MKKEDFEKLIDLNLLFLFLIPATNFIPVILFTMNIQDPVRGVLFVVYVVLWAIIMGYGVKIMRDLGKF